MFNNNVTSLINSFIDYSFPATVFILYKVTSDVNVDDFLSVRNYFSCKCSKFTIF